MTTHQTYRTPPPSRRRMLRGAVFVAGGALFGAGLSASPAAPAKLVKAAANYQMTPKGNARCSNCTHWRPPIDCEVVVGPVSPVGWCRVYAAKS